MMMMNRFVLALVVLSSCSKKSDEEKVREVLEQKLAESEASTAYSSSDGHYSVAFPHGGKAVESVKPDPNKIHGDVSWHHTKSDVGAYAVMWADFKDAATAQQDIDDYAKIMGDRVVSTKDVTIGGHKARELEMKISDSATMWIQLFAIDKREYRVSAGTKNNPTLAHEFLDSFKLL